jgi:hypothetical protein
MKKEHVESITKQAKPKEFCLEDYVQQESVYIDDCYKTQLQKTPNMSKTLFILNYYVTLGYAQKYHEYYFGQRHKENYKSINY